MTKTRGRVDSPLPSEEAMLQIEALLIRSFQGRTAAEEEAALDRWRREDLGNELRYQEVARIWALTEFAAPPLASLTPAGIDSLIEAAEQDQWVEPESPLSVASLTPSSQTNGSLPLPTGAVRVRHWIAIAVAAGIVALAISLSTPSDPTPPEALLAETAIVTGAEERTTLTLADGPTIRLGPGSRLSLTAETGGTVATLDGRAFFAVDGRDSGTFKVRTALGTAEVHGTRFEVRSEGDDFRVLVVDGSVKVSAGGDSVGLGEGEIGHSFRGAPPTMVAVEDVFDQLAWMGNVMLFNQTPLGRIAQELEGRYGITVTLEDPAMARLTLTVSFQDESVENVSRVICQIIGAECVMHPEGLVVLSSTSLDS